MSETLVRRAYLAFRLILGAALLYWSLVTVREAMAETPPSMHLALFGGVEAAGAALFLWPRTLRWGACVLLAVLLAAFAIHGVRGGHWRLELIVYAAGVALVGARGARWP